MSPTREKFVVRLTIGSTTGSRQNERDRGERREATPHQHPSPWQGINQSDASSTTTVPCWLRHERHAGVTAHLLAITDVLLGEMSRLRSRDSSHERTNENRRRDRRQPRFVPIRYPWCPSVTGTVTALWIGRP